MSPTMKHLFLTLATLLLTPLAVAVGAEPAIKSPSTLTPVNQSDTLTITIDSQSPGRTFEGLGAVSAGGPGRLLMEYPEPYRSDILDFLFTPQFGAGFQHLKVEIGSGMNSTCAAEPSHAITPEELKNPVARGYEFWLATEARKRNPNIILDALPWGTPYWTTNYFTKEAADWAVSFLDVAKKQYGLTFQYIAGGQNERDKMLGGPDPEKTKTFIMKYLRPALDEHGYQKVGIVASDFYNPRTPGKFKWSMMKDVLKDPEYFKTVAAVAYHYPVGYMTKFLDERPLPKGFIQSGKRFWASEDYSVGGGAFASGWDYIGKVIREYNELRITKSEAWPPYSALPPGFLWDNTGFVHAKDWRSGNYTVYPALWCVAHITQFVQPGWKFLDNAQGRFDKKSPHGMYAAFAAPNGRDWSLIAVTEKPVSVKIKIDPDMSASEVYIWKSDEKEQFKQIQTVKPVNGVLSINLDQKSIYTLTTTTGQRKGEATHPIPELIVNLPWQDDFRDYKIHDNPKGWVDQEGTFEIANFKGANVLKQVVPKVGLKWTSSLGKCLSYFAGSNPVFYYSLKAKCWIANGYTEIGSSHLLLRLYQNGEWTLGTVAEKKEPAVQIAKGVVNSFQAEAWHDLSYRIDGENKVTCEIDGQQVYTGPIDKKIKVLPAIGSSYDPNMFQSVEITYEKEQEGVAPETLRTPENGVFQWHVETKYKFSEGPQEKIASAYLWIPEHCQKVRGALLLFRNIIDESLSVNPAIRAVCEKNDLAIVWISNYIYFEDKNHKELSGTPQEYVEFVGKIFNEFAAASGYSELSTAPWLPLGQSAQLPMLTYLLNGNPARCIAEIAMKDPCYTPDVNNSEVPILNWKGNGSSWDQATHFFKDWNTVNLLKFYTPVIAKHAKFPDSPVSYVMEGWSSHFGATETLVQYLAEYIASVTKARLPDKFGEPLKKIYVSKGWVTGLPIPDNDNGRKPFAPIPYDKATAEQKAEPWFFTESEAKRAYEIASIDWNAEPQMPAVANEKGEVYPHCFRGLQQFSPTFGDDGVTFKLNPVLLDTPPASFTVEPGSILRKTPGKPFVYWMLGCAAPLGDDTWQLYLSRSAKFPIPNSDAWLAVYKDGEGNVRGVEQPFHIIFNPNKEGAAQQISFNPIPDIKAGSTPSIILSAKASSGLPVRYYVIQGPAVINGDKLSFTPIPPRSKFPLKVTVVAWQWGIKDKIQTAPSVAQSFDLVER
jgi:galactosylceramidase